MGRTPRTIYKLYTWLFLFPFVALCTGIFGSACIITSITAGEEYTDIFAVIWAKIACFLVPVKVDVSGKENFSPDQSYIIVVNHQSLVDIIILHAYLKLKIKWIMKKELEKVFLFGHACKKLGCIYVDRYNHDSALDSMQEAQKNLSKTSSVIFFPEGTRSKDGTLGEFKKGAFRFAMATRLPILPVTIKDSMKILPCETYDVTPGSAEVIIHPPIDMNNKSLDDLDKLVLRTKETIAAVL